ncbi:MAG: phosphoribosylamine--glycine ligase [bacterium]
MNILLIGSGGREHALAYALYNSKSIEKLYCSAGNPGIFQLAENPQINVDDYNEVTDFCLNKSIDLVVVGPEQPLAKGIADILKTNGINVFGPSKQAAMLESSKGFAKEFMMKYNIPTADFKKFTIENKIDCKNYLSGLDKYPVVIKADGLAAGKGVIIAQDKDEAINTINDMFSGKFGDAGTTVVVEEFMEGEEASILAVTDGKDFVTLASSQDHKRIFDGDKGPNTGGMGAYSPAPIVTEDVLEKVKSQIIIPTINGMINEGTPFIGCLYEGLMIKNGEPKVVEFNVRFGDPETQAVLMNFKGDFAKLLYSAAKGHLESTVIENVCESHTCCIIMASEGYPESYPKGQLIKGIEDAEKNGSVVFHAGTKLDNGQLKASGGRVLGVTAKGNSLKEAIENAYNSTRRIHFDNSYYRNDIGKKGIT